MLKPSKHMDPNRSVLNVSFLILKKMKGAKIVKIDELYDFVIDKLGQDANELILLAFDFLYLIGAIEYSEKRDSLILVYGESDEAS